MSEDQSVEGMGHELDRMMRTTVMMLGQVMERRARRSSEQDRDRAGTARHGWLDERDTARKVFMPMTMGRRDEQASPREFAAAWRAAHEWASVDPVAAAAAEHLSQRWEVLHPDKDPSVVGVALTGDSARRLAEQHAPDFYQRHRNERTTEVDAELVRDWEHWSEHGRLPRESLLREHAASMPDGQATVAAAGNAAAQEWLEANVEPDAPGSTGTGVRVVPQERANEYNAARRAGEVAAAERIWQDSGRAPLPLESPSARENGPRARGRNPVSLEEARRLAEQHAPAYYSAERVSDEQLVADWTHWQNNDQQLPREAVLRQWAAQMGREEELYAATDAAAEQLREVDPNPSPERLEAVMIGAEQEKLDEIWASSSQIDVAQAERLAEQHAPAWYSAPDSATLRDDWQQWTQTGELPADRKREAWAVWSGQSASVAPEAWTDADRGLDEEGRAEALQRIWDDGRDERAALEYAAAVAGVESAAADHAENNAQDAAAWSRVADTLREQLPEAEELVGDADHARTIYEPLLDPTEFNRAEPAEASRAWLAASVWASEDPGAEAAAAQLQQQYRVRHGRDPQTGEEVDRGGQGVEGGARLGEADLKSLDPAGLSIALEQELQQARPATREQVRTAVADATWLHREQLRANRAGMPRTPYIEHPLRNTVRLARAGVRDQDVLVATVLHDVAEDADLQIAQGRRGEDAAKSMSAAQVREEALGWVHEKYGAAVAETVHAVSNPVEEPEQNPAPTDKAEQYRAHVAAAVHDNPRALIVKWSDYVDNAGSLHHNALNAKTAQRASKYAGLTQTWRRELTEQSETIDSLMHPGAAQEQLEVLDRIDSRLTQIVRDADERGVGAQPPTPGQGAAPDPARARIIELHEEAEKFYAQQYPGSKGEAHMVERFGPDGVRRSGMSVGYAPAGWDHMVKHMRGQGVSDEAMIEAGLARRNSIGRLNDVFRDRVVVAVRDHDDGKTVGFTGRDLSDDERAPKYINTPKTAAFDKSRLLVGVSEATDGASLVRVEGAMDAMAINIAAEGRLSGAAPMGTALTSAQAEEMAVRSRGGVVIEALDPDEAGGKARAKDVSTFAKHGVSLRNLGGFRGDPAEAWQRDPAGMTAAMHAGSWSPPQLPASVHLAMEDRLAARPDLLGHDMAWPTAEELAPLVAAAPRQDQVAAARHAERLISARAGTHPDFNEPLHPNTVRVHLRGALEELPKREWAPGTSLATLVQDAGTDVEAATWEAEQDAAQARDQERRAERAREESKESHAAAALGTDPEQTEQDRHHGDEQLERAQSHDRDTDQFRGREAEHRDQAAAVTAAPAPQVYDRASESEPGPEVTPAAAQARQRAAAGFSQSTPAGVEAAGSRRARLPRKPPKAARLSQQQARRRTNDLGR